MVEATAEVALVLNLSQSHRVEGRMAGKPHADNPHIGMVTVMPPGHVFRFTVRGHCRVLNLRLPWTLISEAAEANGFDVARCEILPRVNVEDPLAGADTEPSTLHQVASHLIARARRAPKLGGQSKGGIPPAKLRRVIERIEATLGSALPLAELAQEAGLSPFHFSRAFACTTGPAGRPPSPSRGPGGATTGEPPHRFIVRRRVVRAIQLLTKPELSLGAVAKASGFSNSSHLARAMRRVTGTTPELFRTQVLP